VFDFLHKRTKPILMIFLVTYSVERRGSEQG